MADPEWAGGEMALPCAGKVGREIWREIVRTLPGRRGGSGIGMTRDLLYGELDIYVFN